LGPDKKICSSGVTEENRAVKKTAVHERGLNNQNVHQTEHSGMGDCGRPGERFANNLLCQQENYLINCVETQPNRTKNPKNQRLAKSG